MTPMPPGFLRGQHYTCYVGDVERLVRLASTRVAAERLLLELLAATEAAAPIDHQGIAPWYYEQLANVYQRRGNGAAERAILVRFRQQRAAPGPIRRGLLTRLKTLEAAAARIGSPSRAVTPASAAPVRTCALPGCATALSATQATYCSRRHAGTAMAARWRHQRRAPTGRPTGVTQGTALEAHPVLPADRPASGGVSRTRVDA